jgi:sugar phosphate isomerase/epimerase
MPIPISVQLWSLREQMKDGRHEAVLKQLAEVGYRGVECGSFFGLTAKDFRELVERCGMTVTGYHGGLPKPEKAGEAAETARGLGVDHVTFAYTPPERWATVESIAALAEEVEASRAALAKHGIKLVYHNHDHEIRPVAGRLGLAHLLERVPALLMEIDTYWAANFGAQDPALVVTQFRERSPMLHIKDGPFVKGQPHLAVGAGKMDIPRVVAAADPAVTKWLVVELDECGGDMWQAIVDSHRYLVGRGLAEGRATARSARK